MKCFSIFSSLFYSKLGEVFPVILLLLQIQGCLSMQSFKEEPSYTEVNPGDNTELRCVVNDIGGECRWQKDGKPIGLHPGKYEWAGRQGGGDCSFKINEVNIQYDDGLWECQVTSSTFEAQDQLASKPARLVVREPPKSFSIIRNKKPVEHGGQITVVDGKVETVTCETRKSNPAPSLKWFLGEKELTPSVQNNVTELNDTRRWRSYSTLEHIFTLNDFGKLLTCRVYHPAYAKSPQLTSVSLDLLYKPKVSITRLADDIVEEGKAQVTLSCGADANPPARVFWRKLGSSEERRFVESLEFNPVQRKDTGTYVCRAENSIGVSKEEATEVNVLFPPKILRVTPTGGATIGVHNRSILTCSAEGNPLPKYQWLQKLPTQQVVKRGFEDKLIIDGTSYNDQGEYVCEAVNLIAGRRNKVQSGPVKMEVRGAPQVERRTALKEVEAISGRDVELKMEVCSDPIPSKSTWDWGIAQVEAGQDLDGRFIADQMIEHPNREDCYIARLLVRKVSPEDSKKYFLAVENIHGEDRYAVNLSVQDPVSMASVISVVIVLLVLFVVIVLALLFLYKTQRLCFKDDSKLEKNNGMNDKLDPEMMGRTNPGMKGGMKNGNGNMHGNGHHPLPPDGMYHVSDGNGHGMNGFNGTMTNGMDNGNALAAALTDKLWPENPTYQVYIPGFQGSTTMLAHPNGGVVEMAPHSYINGSTTSINRARSVSPNQNGYGHTIHPGGQVLSSYPQGQPEPQRSTSTTSRIQYAELQFPVTSNYGSMKKKSKKEHRDSTVTTASTSANSSAGGGTGEPSPTHMMMSMDGFDGHKESSASNNNQAHYPAHNTTQSTIASAQSLSSVHRYVPDYVAISNRKTAV